MQRSSQQSGFSLLEVVITVGILMTLTIAVASMMRAGFEVKDGLSQRAKVVHRLAVAESKLVDDIQYAYFVSTKDGNRNGFERKMKSIFKLDKTGTGDKLTLTTKTHRAMTAGSPEGDLTLVVYELRESRTIPGRKDLYRGEYPFIPEDIKEEPQMRLLAANIKTLTMEPWNGEAWSKDYWDTGRGDTRNLLPRMIRITVEAWARDREDGDADAERIDRDTDKIQTVVYLNDAWEYKELKEQTASIKWSNL